MVHDRSLKELLNELKGMDWKIPEEIDRYQLALEAMDNIGSTDPVLRDELILEFLFVLITEKLLSREQIKMLLNISLNEAHLFHGLGQTEDDSVFNRAFTILIVRAIIYYHNNLDDGFLSKDEALRVFNDVVSYVRQEKDYRGFVIGKGWAHAIAHSGDTLRALALCNHLGHDQLYEILELVKEKMNISSYVYINEEAERLTSAVMHIIRRSILSEEEIVRWIRSFNDLEIPKDYPEAHYWKGNIKNLLRSLYFRLKFKEAPAIFTEELEKVLNNINDFFNNLKI